jgi:hypothetical protein
VCPHAAKFLGWTACGDHAPAESREGPHAVPEWAQMVPPEALCAGAFGPFRSSVLSSLLHSRVNVDWCDKKLSTLLLSLRGVHSSAERDSERVRET